MLLLKPKNLLTRIFNIDFYSTNLHSVELVVNVTNKAGSPLDIKTIFKHKSNKISKNNPLFIRFVFSGIFDWNLCFLCRGISETAAFFPIFVYPKNNKMQLD
jgi:hypothetical protein